MGAFGAIVLSEAAGLMDMPKVQLLQRCCVGTKAVGRKHLWRDGLVAEQAFQKLQGGHRIALLLDDEVEHFTLVVNGAPEIHPLAADGADHFIEMPTRGGRLASAAQANGNLRTNLIALLRMGS